MIVEVLGPDDVRVVDVGDLGRLAGDTGFLDVAALREAARSQSTAPGWATDWDATVAAAGGKGWLADDGASLRVHVESAASG